MANTIIDNVPLFELSSSKRISARPEDVYAVVSDLGRSGEWSPECQGGEWVSGAQAQVGSIFRGENLRSTEVVAWAPVIRGIWYMESKVTAAEPGRTFEWMILTKGRGEQESIWGFDVEPDGAGAVLTHRFRMGRATAGIHEIVSELNEQERVRFIDEWTAKLQSDLDETLDRIKVVIEKQ